MKPSIFCTPRDTAAPSLPTHHVLAYGPHDHRDFKRRHVPTLSLLSVDHDTILLGTPCHLVPPSMVGVDLVENPLNLQRKKRPSVQMTKSLMQRPRGRSVPRSLLVRQKFGSDISLGTQPVSAAVPLSRFLTTLP